MGLLLVGAYVYFWYLHRRSITDMSPGRKRLALGLRLVLVTLLFLALAGTRWVRKNDALAVLFVLDASRSLRDDQKEAALRFVQAAAKGKRRNDTLGLITFGRDPHTQIVPGASATPSNVGGPGGLQGVKHYGATNATDIAQALEAAPPQIPRGMAGKIVLLSDGNENVGSALAVVPSLTARGVKVDTVLLPSSLKKEALIEKTVLPAQVKIGEPFNVKVIVHALNAQAGRLSLRRDGRPVGKARTVEITAGRRAYDFEVSVDKPGFYRFEATLETNADDDTILENNKGLGFVSVRGRPQILYVAQTPRLVDFLRRSLKKQNIDVVYAPPEAMPTTSAAFQHFDSVILSDVPRFAFSQAQMSALQASTRDFGVGFVMIGGENSFGLGGYRKTVVEEMLPVRLDIRKMQRFPPVCVALVIDRSGSMMEGAAGGGGRKIDLAIEAAIRAVQALKPTDKVAGISFTTEADLQVPLTLVENPNEIIARLQRIGPEGGTSVYSGAKLAYDTIKDDETPIKHVILLTDGQSADPDWRPLVAEMKKRKITVTTVGVGSGAGDINAPLLAWLAKETGGRFYSVERPKDIPGIYLQEIERISSRPLVEEPFTPRVSPGAEERLPGISLDSLPPLLGYNVTEPKPTADLLLRSHRNEPVLATWRYGLGRTMAFTSDDKNKWAAHWLPWSGYGQFWAQAIRWTMRSLTPSDFQTQVTMEGSRGHIVVDAIDKDGRYVNRLNFRAKVAGPDADTSEASPDIPLRQTGPGRYEATFDAAQIGTYLVNVTRERPDKSVESTITGLVVPYSPEYKDLSSNDFLMTQLAQAGSGALLTNPAQVFSGNRPVVYAPLELAPYLLLFALLLFPVDVGVRRLALQRDDFRRVWEWIRARLGRAPRVRKPGATPELVRLRNVKARVRAGDGHVEGRALSIESSTLSAPASDARRPTTPSPAAVIGRTAHPPSVSADFAEARRERQNQRPSAPSADRHPQLEGRPSTETAPESDSETLTGMGRLMAAKRRAQQQQQSMNAEE